VSENQEPTSETKLTEEETPIRTGGMPKPWAGVVAKLQETIFTEQVQQEMGKAWQFTQTKVLPPIGTGLTWLVDKLDPPLSAGWQKLTQALETNPNWQKLWQNPNWQKASTAVQPVIRWLSQAGSLLWTKFTERVPLSAGVQYILTKRAALTAIALVLVAVWLLKPAPTRVAVTANNKPVASRSALPSQVSKQISAVADTYGTGLVQSIVGSKQVGRLVVELSDQWYQLTPEQQDQLVTEMHRRATKLQFPQVLVADNAHHLLARPATVGNSMIVVRR
jgi:hypothetical protein